MNATHIVVSARTVARGLAVVLGLAVCSMPANAEAREKKEAPGGRAAPTVDQKTGAKLNQAIEHMNAGRFQEARDVLAKLDGKRLSPYEIARIENVYAAIAQAQERYGEARQHLLKAIQSEGLNEQEVLSSRFQVAQLFMAEERWKDGIDGIKAWLAAGATPNSNAYYLLAIGYYQLKDYGAAIEPAQKAIDLSEKPQESWLQLLMSLRLERDEHALALPIVRRLVAMAPNKKAYWLQLSAIYGMMEKYEEALVPMQLAYFAGLLTEEVEYRRLADLLLHQGVPHRAALLLTKVLEEKKLSGDVKDWEKLGNCWIASRYYDKAVPPLTRAAGMSKDGDLFVRLAEVQIQREDWPKAAEALKKAFEKGSLKRPADAELLMGIALFNQKLLKEARVYFQRAATDERNRSQAEGWLRYVSVELRS